MNILVIADEESKSLWDYYDETKLAGIDLILSCGDLSPSYLSFLVTMAKAPVLYIHGNHDDRYERTPPEGCVCVEDMIYVYQGIRILGLGGSMRYKPGVHQYTEKEMQKRVRKLRFSLWRHGGFDILLTHSPALGVNDGDDLPHKGFGCFCTLMDKYKPKYFIHGHVHQTYGRKHKRLDLYGETQVINAYEKFEFDYENPKFLRTPETPASR
ncbi:MAG: metallophosphoesterase family protein [Eubacteriales bacterium]|nr:metallophosphoesterase family protein [Eubacteriales bacterium]